ncbi:MAG: DoxX family protein [Rhodocyclaceae bacterium]|nr:MAG: DoxX family protein [Rhodocyclaceae bacterium]
MTPQALLLRLPPFVRRVIGLIEGWLTPCFDLCIRLYIASVFLPAGMLKLRDWGSTLALFEHEYHVPLLPTGLAAVLGTGGELVFPVLLVIGLAGRFSAAGLSVINIVAVVAYTDISDLGRQDHLLWGLLLLVTLLHGPGRLSCDAWLSRRWSR